MSWILRLKYRETLLIQLLDQPPRQWSLSFLPAMSPIQSLVEGTHLCKDRAHSEWLQTGQTIGWGFFCRWRQNLLSYIQKFVPVLTRGVELHRRHSSLIGNANYYPHAIANTQIALESNMAHTSDKRTGQAITSCDTVAVVHLLKSKTISDAGVGCLQKETTTMWTSASWLEATHSNCWECKSSCAAPWQLSPQSSFYHSPLHCSVCLRGEMLSPAALGKTWCILWS